MATMNQRGSLLVAVAAVLVLCAPPAAGKPGKAKPHGKQPKPDPWLDVPRMAQTGSPTERSVLTVTCTLVAGSMPRRARCISAQGAITGPPDAKELADATAVIDAISKKEKAKLLKESCTAKELAALKARAIQPPESDYAARVSGACAKKDADKLVDALRWNIANVAANTCKLSTHHTEQEFTQKDADTWVWTETGWLCSITTTGTLWRKPGESLWNYRQARSVPPNADSKLCALSEVPVEWRWDSLRTRDLGCKYFEF